LLKNHVVETTGLAAYALYTEAVHHRDGPGRSRCRGLVEHREEFEGVGRSALAPRPARRLGG
jgi:hypothetical protein